MSLNTKNSEVTLKIHTIKHGVTASFSMFLTCHSPFTQRLYFTDVTTSRKKKDFTFFC